MYLGTSNRPMKRADSPGASRPDTFTRVTKPRTAGVSDATAAAAAPVAVKQENVAAATAAGGSAATAAGGGGGGSGVAEPTAAATAAAGDAESAAAARAAVSRGIAGWAHRVAVMARRKDVADSRTAHALIADAADKAAGGAAVVKQEGPDGAGGVRLRPGYSQIPPRMGDAALAHDLLVHGYMRLDFFTGRRDPGKGAAMEAHKIYYAVFWDLVEKELTLKTVDVRVRCVLTELRDALTDLLLEDHVWDDDGVVSSLDRLLAAPLTVATFGYAEQKTLVGGVMGFLPTLPREMPAPVPPALSCEKLRGLLQTATGDLAKEANAFAVALRFILDRIRVLRVAATHIRADELWGKRPRGTRLRVAPWVPENESAKARADYVSFVGKLPASSTPFTRTQKWIRATIASGKWDYTVTEGRAGYNVLLCEGGVTLVTGAAPSGCATFDATTLPETLQYDLPHFKVPQTPPTPLSPLVNPEP